MKWRKRQRQIEKKSRCYKQWIAFWIKKCFFCPIIIVVVECLCMRGRGRARLHLWGLLIATWFVNWLENRCFPFKSILIKIGRFVKRMFSVKLMLLLLFSVALCQFFLILVQMHRMILPKKSRNFAKALV